MNINSGIVNIGDNNSVNNSAVGDGATATAHTPTPQSAHHLAKKESPWDVGVVTILPEELKAVTDTLEMEKNQKTGGLFFHTGQVNITGGTIRVVATQSHSQGQRSIMSTLENLRRHFSPRLWVLVGVGGGIHYKDDEEYAGISSVIVSTRVVYYENRKITPAPEAQRRGEAREAPADIVHAVNAYFTDHGDPATLHRQLPDHGSTMFRAFPGLIGSGEAVIADRDSEIRTFLKEYNDKVLAVDMEAGGLSQFWQENSVHNEHNPGWVVVRGISDNADQHKGHEHHGLASYNAAYVLRELLPYLC